MKLKNDIDLKYDLTYMRFLIQQCDALAHNPIKLEKRKKYLDDVQIKILKRK